ncbi:MAG: hypothetical protein LPH21_01380 [Shewanella sp.]|nr:hypothetical protein [Shewanella sp.]MCF1456259.1 hypothetical protein [Shewanella sp.]
MSVCMKIKEIRRRAQAFVSATPWIQAHDRANAVSLRCVEITSSRR